MTDPAADLPNLTTETAIDAAAVARVVETAFGPGRYAKTAERLRENSRPQVGFVMRAKARVVGSVRLWPVWIGETSATFLGPIAVDRDWREAGLGATLVAACISWSEERGVPGLLLVGDPPFFGRFGFRRIENVALPGPVDPARLLWLSLDGTTPTGPVRRG